MPSAIVTGATGILGREIVFELGRHPQQWPTVHALSRSRKEDYPSNVVHSHIDLTSSADDMANDLQNVRGEYIFFAAYLQQDTEQGNWDVNGAMLDNFLQALAKTGAIKNVKRIILVTGCKQYGVHLGATKVPMTEDDKWLTGDDRPPNFYYNQQNILHRFCKEHDIEWTVTYPNDVIGYAEGNFMNLSTAVGLYAAISKELGQELVFPGSPEFYVRFDSFTDSKLHAQFCAWAAMEPRAANQAFNVVNGDAESWQHMWPKVASYFGMKVKPDQFETAWSSKVAGYLGMDAGGVQNLQDRPPIADFANSMGLKGHPVTHQSRVEQVIDLVKWSQRSDVKKGWKTLAEREGLKKDALEKATWTFLGFVLGRNYEVVVSMSKARKAGWTGYIDTWEALEGVFEELAEAKILPKRDS
ncbi:NAD dependent epimerase/dehydratase family protein [Delitschia confertaspora ATCC 74209]|uniref:NAD dependent epimerase/dehydratase family protein n=1 Tax=Delitschia confertaspora ATCC 74209 TaxID=1513339 RepID=A0A9P4JC28_9PLEO|nr:NAD dependent epimerase/dehydratase family protein [Delitschia confertaspora ATCC 74209]